jgi:transposase
MKRRGNAVLADKAYSNKALRRNLKLRGIKVVIPHKLNEKASTDGRTRFDKETYRKRNVVERSFGLLKENRRIATRYEKTARNYLSMVQLGCIRLFLRRIGN